MVVETRAQRFCHEAQEQPPVPIPTIAPPEAPAIQNQEEQAPPVLPFQAPEPPAGPVPPVGPPPPQAPGPPAGQAPPPVQQPQAPAMAAFLLGRGHSADDLDYTTRLGRKIYFKASSTLEEKPDTFNNFMAKVANHARTFGWETILAVNNFAGTPRNLLTSYDMVTLDNVQAHATANYVGQQTRDAQNTEMLYHFVYDSLGPKFQINVHQHKNDHIVSTGLDGVSLLKHVIMLTFIDTQVAMAHI